MRSEYCKVIPKVSKTTNIGAINRKGSSILQGYHMDMPNFGYLDLQIKKGRSKDDSGQNLKDHEKYDQKVVNDNLIGYTQKTFDSLSNSSFLQVQRNAMETRNNFLDTSTINYKLHNRASTYNFQLSNGKKYSTIDYEAKQCIGKGTFGRVLKAKAFSRTFMTYESLDDICLDMTNPLLERRRCQDFNPKYLPNNRYNSEPIWDKDLINSDFYDVNKRMESNHSKLLSTSEYYVAIKVLRNKDQYINQGREEINFLEQINRSVAISFANKESTNYTCFSNSFPAASDKTKFNKNLIKMISSFVNDTGELCIVFEILKCNLFEFMKLRLFQPLHLHEIRIIMTQLCVGLSHMHSIGIIHTDLKPENIMLVDDIMMPLAVRIIDLGSACSTANAKYLTYLQSRYYRSPEIIMALPFDTAVDMWSLGCVGVEMYLGAPLYPGNSEYDLLKFIISTQGPLPKSMMENSRKTSYFFDSNGSLKSNAEICNTLGSRYESKETRKYLMRSLSSLVLFESPDDEHFRKLSQEGDFNNYVVYLNQILKNPVNLSSRYPSNTTDSKFQNMTNISNRSSHVYHQYAHQSSLDKMISTQSTNNLCGVRSDFATLRVLYDLRPNKTLIFSGDRLAHDKQLFWRETMARCSDKSEFVRLICSMMHLCPSERCTASQALQGGSESSDFLTMNHLLMMNSYPNVYVAKALDLNNDCDAFCDLGNELPTTARVFRNSHNCTISPQVLNKYYWNDSAWTTTKPSSNPCNPSIPASLIDLVGNSTSNLYHNESSNSTCDSLSTEFYDDLAIWSSNGSHMRPKTQKSQIYCNSNQDSLSSISNRLSKRYHQESTLVTRSNNNNYIKSGVNFKKNTTSTNNSIPSVDLTAQNLLNFIRDQHTGSSSSNASSISNQNMSSFSKTLNNPSINISSSASCTNKDREITNEDPTSSSMHLIQELRRAMTKS